MKKEDFDDLTLSIRQMRAIMRGEMEPSRVTEIPEVDVRALRESLGASQSVFASMLGISVGTLRNWEQGRSYPDAPTRVLLAVIAKHPEAVEDVLGKAS